MASLALSHLEEAAGAIGPALTASVAAPHPPFGEAKRAITVREPFGVVLAMAPWNAPIILGLRSVLYAVAAGNAVVMKTSEFSPRTHLIVYDLLRAAGLPDGVLNVLHIHPKQAPEVVESIIANDAVGFVNFTGSTRVGQILAATCGKYLKPCIMELGGKAPMIVLPDADLDVCANHIIMAGYLHAGQICMSTNNLLVHESVAAQLTEKVVANFEKYKLTAAVSRDSHIRSLFSPTSAQRVSDLYEDAIQHGAEVAAGTPGFDGALVQPLLLSGVTSEMKIFRNETFGPVVGIATFADKQQAIDAVNNNPEAGLSASVYGANETECWLVAKELVCGAVHVSAPLCIALLFEKPLR